MDKFFRNMEHKRTVWTNTLCTTNKSMLAWQKTPASISVWQRVNTCVKPINLDWFSWNKYRNPYSISWENHGFRLRFSQENQFHIIQRWNHDQIYVHKCEQIHGFQFMISWCFFLAYYWPFYFGMIQKLWPPTYYWDGSSMAGPTSCHPALFQVSDPKDGVDRRSRDAQPSTNTLAVAVPTVHAWAPCARMARDSWSSRSRRPTMWHFLGNFEATRRETYLTYIYIYICTNKYVYIYINMYSI